MWKPGAERPNGATEPPIRPKNPLKSPPGTGRNSGGVRGLSGATRNMRFMQRTSPQKINTTKEPTGIDDDDAMEVEEISRDSIGNSDETGDKCTDEAVQEMGSQKVLSSSTLKVTPLEMYGPERSIAIGRRSFGGFNKVTAETYFHQQNAIQDGATESNVSSSKRRSLDDARLVQDAKRLKRDAGRLKGISKQRRRNGRSSH